jgi:WD40-like Beta Propeller Repeat
VTAPDLTRIEDRLRSAYREVADTVRPQDISPGPRAAARVTRWQRRMSGHSTLRVAAPLAAALAVAVIIAAGLFIPRGSLRQPAARGGYPPFTISIADPSFWVNIRDSATGRLTDRVKTPDGVMWNSVTAEAGGNFIAVSPDAPSLLYRIHVNAEGADATMKLIASVHHADIVGASISPDGTWLAYQNFYTPPRHASQLLLGLRNLRAGKNVATWSMPGDYGLSGLSVDAAGNEIAVSAYYYLGHGATNTALIQHTYVLRPGSSGTPLNDLPAINDQSGPLALSPDGKTLYEVLQATGLSRTSFLSHKTVAFELAAISTATGRVTAVLHTWRARYRNFVPLLALDPTGRYLLVTDKTAMATIDLRSGRYTALPGELAPEIETQSHPGSNNLGPIYPFNPIAW